LFSGLPSQASRTQGLWPRRRPLPHQWLPSMSSWGLGRPFVKIDGVAHHGDGVGVIEQGVEGIEDDDIQVEEQHLAFQVAVSRCEHGELGPAVFRDVACCRVEWWQRGGLDVGMDAGGVVGEAEEAVGEPEVAAHAAGQQMHVARAVARTPLHA